jgi:hypothetical protein
LPSHCKEPVRGRVSQPEMTFEEGCLRMAPPVRPPSPQMQRVDDGRTLVLRFRHATVRQQKKRRKSESLVHSPSKSRKYSGRRKRGRTHSKRSPSAFSSCSSSSPLPLQSHCCPPPKAPVACLWARVLAGGSEEGRPRARGSLRRAELSLPQLRSLTRADDRTRSQMS